MKAILTLTAALLVTGGAQAGEVFKTTDAKGNAVYTDRPETLPAQKVDVKTQQTDTVTVQKRYEAQMKAYDSADKAAAEAAKQAAGVQKASDLSAEDRAQRCVEARTRYQQVMNSPRLYTQAPGETERHYLTSEEIDATRASAKQVMDAFCTGQ